MTDRETIAERAARGAHDLGPVFEELLAELAAGVRWGPAWRAIMLGTSVEVADALLRGEKVPVERIDPDQAARFGRRES